MWGDDYSSTVDGDDGEEVTSSYAGSHSGSERTGATLAPLQSSESSEEESYDNDTFDDYSDEFEAEDNDSDSEPNGPGSANAQTDISFFRMGDRVQVFWDEECEWFDGSVAHVQASQCFVRYTDGEEQWEPVDIIRPAPPATVRWAHQLQLVSDSSLTPIGQRIVAYWHAELSWFGGRIMDVKVADGIVQEVLILYDDGDRQWIARTAFRDVPLVASDGATNSIQSSLDQHPGSAEVSTERFLTPRKYTPTLATHFEPVRIARPYRCSIQDHIGSIITPRRPDEQKRSFYNSVLDVKLDFKIATCPVSSQSCPVKTRDCEMQTEIAIVMTSSA